MRTEPFPRRVVTGEGFCNRTKERTTLSKLLLQGTHIWIQAHRRHGKSSLLEQVGEDLREGGHDITLDRCHILFNSGHESLIRQLLQTTSNLLGQTAAVQARKNGYTKTEAVIDYIKAKFNKVELNVKLDRGMPSISFEKNSQNVTLNSLREAMSRLDEYAYESDVRAIFIIDEFQELGKTDGGIEIESAIRHQLEQSKAITFVFCGSERALMAQSLTDQKRPLYNHTKPFPLNRIAPDHYKGHFNKLAQNEWGSDLPDDVIDKVLSLSECHPYYVNAICSDLWLLPSLPDLDDVAQVWQEVVDMAEREEKGLILSLSTNDKKLLSGIARGINEKLQSKDAYTKMNLAPSSVKRSLESLINKDLVEKSEDGTYRVINPVIAEIARRHS
ncbi:hypothetical protein FWP33_07495 [Vibrio parahaemolyticus]|jgi:hypothetical protein|nr:hypothetical protein [Vibrio parahaemolyticus]EJC7176028.1 hypothetical protein [Vibrio parahaemolyticus]EJE4724467.1 hypothetical protein [Vibrio parahaemolyticus]EJG0009761.1 hypothetical protein [Vibrio parahaemolyticus]ELA8176596.1 hypothetical protein [Vibrio alginolyticus]